LWILSAPAAFYFIRSYVTLYLICKFFSQNSPPGSFGAGHFAEYKRKAMSN
jgi:hypothetical protein